jgi:adenosylcobinamide kinase/adenosylcobinamide-phosphate guanylyltransferase
MERTMIVFVSGGVRSGKSSFAENLLANQPFEGKRHYIATSYVTDQEMENRIIHHQKNRGNDWITWEQPHSIDTIVDNFSSEDLVLIDCLTILTANELFKDGKVYSERRVHNEILRSISILDQKVKQIVVVSNDLFSNGVPQDEGTFIYMKVLGLLHQEIVKLSNQAYQVSYGIPKQMKG